MNPTLPSPRRVSQEVLPPPEDPARRRVKYIFALALIGIVAYLGMKGISRIYSYMNK